MKSIFKILLYFYVLALVTSMAGMEIFAWSSTLCLLAVSVLKWTRGQTKLRWQTVGVELSVGAFALIVLIGLLLKDPDNDILYCLGRIRNLALLFVLPFLFDFVEKKEKLFHFMLGVGVVVAIYGIWQHFTGIDLWRQNQRALLPVPWGQRDRYSTVGLFNHHLTYGHSYMMLLCFPFASLLLRLKSRFKIAEYLFLFSFLIIGISLIFTYGRGVWIAVLFALPFMAYLVNRRIVAVMLGIFIFAGIALNKYDPLFGERAKSIFAKNYSSNDDRRLLWKANLKMYSDNLWIGVGYQQNEKLLPKYYSKMKNVYDGMIGHAHNNYVQILATTGTLGFAVYMCLIGLLFTVALQLYWRIPTSARFDKTLALTAVGAQAAFHIGGLTQFNFGDMKVLHQFIFWAATVLWLRKRYKMQPLEIKMISYIWNKLTGAFADSNFKATLFAAFTLVCIKKWEPGGNLDTIWYSAIAKNIYLTGDYFHFTISQFYYKNIFDHMPLTYWITALAFELFGPSDFVARLYPMFCSIISYLLVYKIGKRIKDETYGILAVIVYTLCFGATKWNGALMHDVPLTTFYLGTFYFFLRGQEKSKYYYLSALFFALGVFTKGPIIFGFGLALILWTLTSRNFEYLKSRDFFYSLIFLMSLLCLPLFNFLEFDGFNIYTLFMIWKSSYLAPSYWYKYFAYFLLSLQMATIATIGYVASVVLAVIKKKSPFGIKSPVWSFTAWIAASIILPLSFFGIKYPHYLLPYYPFLALAGTAPVYAFTKRWSIPWPKVIHALCILFLCLFVALPMKTTGSRSKDLINLVNLIKLDPKIKDKTVYFLGRYVNDMAIFQTFKFYGSIDLKPIWPFDLDKIDLKKSYLVVSQKHLPVQIGGTKYGSQNCPLFNEYYCILSDPNSTQIQLPIEKFPHEVY